jgi:hypothetical protein
MNANQPAFVLPFDTTIWQIAVTAACIVGGSPPGAYPGADSVTFNVPFVAIAAGVYQIQLKLLMNTSMWFYKAALGQLDVAIWYEPEKLPVVGGSPS